MNKLTDPLLKFLSSNKAFRIVTVYFVISFLWIFFTDDLVFKVFSDARTQQIASSIKGWGFVIATTLLLFYLIHQALLKVSTAEKKLVESEVKFRSVFENSVDAMVVSKEGKHLFGNKALITLFGYSDRELTGKPVIELIAPLQRESVSDIVRRRAKGENVPSVYETVGLRKDGTLFDLDVNVSNYHLNTDNYTLVIFRDISERKKSENAVRESEQRYQTLANISPVGIFRTDTAGGTTYVNPKWCEISGLSAQEALGSGWLKAVHDEDKEMLIKQWENAANERKPSLAEYRFVQPDGSIVWVMGQAVPIINYENKIDGFIGTVTDITGRKKAEEELKKSFEKTMELETIINRSPAVAFLWRAEENWPVEYVSDNVSQFGYTTDELLSSKVLFPEIIYSGDLERVANEVTQYSETGVDEFVQEYRIITKSGDVRYIDDRTWIRRGDGNKITHYQGIVLDITERKKAEEIVKESERRFAGIMRSVDLVSIILDSNGNINFGNNYFLKLTGYKEEEVINKNWFDLFIPGDIRETLKNVFNDALSKNLLPPHYVNDIVAKNGEKKLISWNNTVLKDTDGRTIGTASIGEDITEQKRLEQELLKNSQQLQALTAHLQRIREEEREFIAREMHDELGQILTSLKMNIVFLKRELEKNTSAEMKNKILAEFEFINLTIDKAVSEVRKLITQLRPELLDKLGLVPALEWYAEEYSKRTNIKCEFTSECGELILSHDLELAVFRIVQEAMTNTAKHSGAKSVQIRACKKGSLFSVEITDDGKGIPESELDGDTSFGLLGMRERAHLIGGTLRVSGVSGKGTTVKLSVEL